MRSALLQLVRSALCLAFVLSCSLSALGQAATTLAQFMSEVSKAIVDSSGAIKGKPRVMVTEFEGLKETPEELANGFTKEVYEELSRNATAFDVVEHEAYADSFKVISVDDPLQPSIKQTCFSDQPAPTYSLNGFVEQRNDDVMLWIKITRLVETSLVFDRQALVVVTPEIKSRAAELRAGERKAFASAADLVWTRPGLDVSSVALDVPVLHNGEDKGFKWPQCTAHFENCRRAPYPDKAAVAKVQGKVSLKVLVDAEGRPARIILLKGISCDFGLNQAVVEAVSSWKMTPARNSNGNPVAVWVEVDLTFSLY